MSELERSYRRWLRVYPASYRRERGLEMITTLLEAAGPEQTRPSRGEVTYLLLMGLKFRFVAPTRLGRVAAGLVAIWAAVVLGGAGAFAAWAIADPREPDLAAFSDALAGRPAAMAYQAPGGSLLEMAIEYRASGQFANLARAGWDGVRPAPSGWFRQYEEVTATPAVMAEAHRRLSGAGWQTGRLQTTALNGGPEYQVFWAHRDEALMRVIDHGGGVVEISAFPAEPGGVPAGAIAGSVIGLIVAWQAVTLLAQRAARMPRLTRRLILLAGLPALLACAINTLDNLLSMGPDVDALRGVIPPSGEVFLAADLMYPLANTVENPLAAMIVAITAAGCAGLLRQTGRARPVALGKAG